MLYDVENTVRIGKYVKVFIDGEEHKDCIEADDEKGYAICHHRNSDGELYLDKNGEVATVRIEGEVSVVMAS